MAVDNEKLFKHYCSWGFDRKSDGKYVRKKAVGKFSDFMTQAIMDIPTNLSWSKNFHGPFREDLAALGTLKCYETILERKFDPNVGKSIFNYLTKICAMEFTVFRRKEGVNAVAKYNLSIAHGMKPNVDMNEAEFGMDYLKNNRGVSETFYVRKKTIAKQRHLPKFERRK